MIFFAMGIDLSCCEIASFSRGCLPQPLPSPPCDGPCACSWALTGVQLVPGTRSGCGKDLTGSLCRAVAYPSNQTAFPEQILLSLCDRNKAKCEKRRIWQALYLKSYHAVIVDSEVLLFRPLQQILSLCQSAPHEQMQDYCLSSQFLTLKGKIF